MSKPTLLEKALIKPHRPSRLKLPEGELEDLAIAYMKSDIGFTAVSNVLTVTGSSAYSTIAASLRRAYAKGRIKIV